MFHKSFLGILRGEDALDKVYNKLISSGVTGMNFDLLPKTAETIEKAAPFLLQSMKKEQELIETNKEYYVARDISTNTYYICYKDILMLDIDTSKSDDDMNDILSRLQKEENKCFSVYKSTNGYHIFCVSHRFNYRDTTTIEFMLKYSCDFYYTAYAYIRGYSVRLNRKFTENMLNKMYTFVGYVGDEKTMDKSIDKLVRKHLDLSKKYDNSINLQTFFV